MLGICLPGFVGFIRVVIIGLQNTSLFGVERTRAFSGYAPDATLWVTAAICALATALLFTLFILERRRGRTLTSGLVYGILGAAVTGLHWYVLSI